jgi:hypothetical protein
MNKEPLKDKALSFNAVKEWIESTSEEKVDWDMKLECLFHQSDIKSAIEWLKEESWKFLVNEKVTALDRVAFKEIIDKAFEDIAKK